MFSISNLALAFGARTLFANVNLTLNLGVCYGLVGANGCGKSTFLKILSGLISPSDGIFAKPKNAIIGVLRQDYYHFEKDRIIDVVLMGQEPLWNALCEKEKILSKEELLDEDIENLGNLEDLIEKYDGYSAEGEVSALLEGLGIDKNQQENPLGSLSGGYKIRVLLAQLLFKKPALLLLDEPTNYLDINSIYWLENYLKSFKGAMVVCSHDRSFLNGICHEILDIDYEKISVYKGNYDDFVSQKIEKALQLSSQKEGLEKKQEHLQNYITRFGAKASKASQAQSKLKSLVKIEEEKQQFISKPTSRRYPNFNFPDPKRSSEMIVSLEGIEKSYLPRKILDGVGFEIHKHDKIAIVGPNGVGKSTLLEILNGYIQPDAGQIKWGQSLEVAYFPQHFERELKDALNPLDHLMKNFPLITEQKIRAVLGACLFTKDDVLKSIKALSGGEKARVVMASIMLKNPNVIFADEPTNHLDLEACESLEEAFTHFDGTICVVSHNRYFISQFANRIIEITPRGIFDFKGSYEEYLAKTKQDFLSHHKEEKKQKTPKTETKKPDDKKGKEIQKLENLCQEYEIELSQILERLSKDDFYDKNNKEEVNKVVKRKEEIEKSLKEIYEKLENLL